VDAQDEELDRGSETRIHDRAVPRCIAVHRGVVHRATCIHDSAEIASTDERAASAERAVVPIRAISAFCAFVERQREEEVQRTR